MAKLELPSYAEIKEVVKTSSDFKKRLEKLKEITRSSKEASVEFVQELSTQKRYWQDVSGGETTSVLPTIYENNNHDGKVVLFFLHSHPSYSLHRIGLAPSYEDILFNGAILNRNTEQIAGYLDIETDFRCNEDHRQFAKKYCPGMHVSGILGVRDSSAPILTYQPPLLATQEYERQYIKPAIGRSLAAQINHMNNLGLNVSILNFKP